MARAHHIGAMSQPSRLHQVVRVLGQRTYGTYAAGNAVSLIGTWMHRVAAGWLAWEITHSATWLGIVAFADLFPTVVTAPLAGAAADRWDRLWILRVTAAVAAALAAALFVLSIAGVLGIFALLSVTLGLGLITGIAQPARLALIASLVPREDLTTAVAINSIVFNLARFVGPALAGVTIVGGGVALVFALNALSYAAFFVALSRLPGEVAEQDPVRARRGGGSLGSDLVEGLQYTLAHRGIAPLLGLLVITNVCGRPFTELLPGFAAQVFGTGADGLAMMTSAIGLGAVFGAAWLIGQSAPRRLAAVTVLSTLGLAVAIAFFIESPRLAYALPVLAAAGAAMVGAGVGTQTLIQLSVAPAMRGRVLALYGLIFRGGPALGALVMGALADRVGLALPIGVGAGVVAVATLGLFLRYRPFVAALEAGRDDVAAEIRG